MPNSRNSPSRSAGPKALCFLEKPADNPRPPKERRVLLAVMVVRPHPGGGDPLAFPQMEILGGHERHHEVPEVPRRVRERALRHDVELRRAVLQTAAEADRLPNDVEEHR